jgi:tyrosine-specific transport protein
MSERSITKRKTVFGATMMVTGCCIGAGMIGLPVVSELAGFMPSVVAMLLCYIFTTTTGLLLLEATLWFDDKVNLPSIVEFALGKVGKAITVGLFLFLFYCLFVAYLDAGGSLFAEILSGVLHIKVPHAIGIITCMGFIFTISYAGTAIVDGFNKTMLIGMIISYFILITLGLPNIEKQNLLHSDWKSMFGVVPILLICFGYQNLVPSITYYLNKNIKAIRLAIIIGNLIPFFIYFIWDYVILGMLSGGSVNIGNDTEMVTELLQKAVMSSLSVVIIVKSFSLFAMLTSFLPNAISFADFLKDGFSKFFNYGIKSDLLVYGLIFIPSTICALIYPRLFLHALSFAGGFIDVLLYGVLPATVILVGRRIRKTESAYQVIGGSLTPSLILTLSAMVLFFKLSS